MSAELGPDATASEFVEHGSPAREDGDGRAAAGNPAVAAHHRLVSALMLAGDWFDRRHPEQLAQVLLRSLDAGTAPVAMGLGYPHPELLVLATGAGSVIFSHVNDGGFWLIKEYFNMTVAQTFKTWTVLETLISLIAFAFTLGLAQVL